MVRDERAKFTWVGIIVLAVILLVIPAVYAGDMEPNPAGVAAAEAQEAEIELGKLLRSIEADRFSVVDDLVNRLATDEITAEQLRATLDSLSTSKLAEIVQKATSIDDVTTILTGKTPEELADDILALGDLDRDFVYSPVRPCRIVDTRKTVAGAMSPGETREFYVWGKAVAAQGGAADCPSPRGEPRGVHINVTAVPQSGQGNLRAYPANVSPPNASLVNYKAGVQNIANAATIQTFFSPGGNREIEIQNRVGTAHVVIDVLGYYDNVHEEDFKVKFAGNFSNTWTEIVGLACTNHMNVSITVPGPGKIMVTAQPHLILDSHISGDEDMTFAAIGSSPTDCTLFNASQGYSAGNWHMPGHFPSWSESDGVWPHSGHVSRTFTVSSAGTYTYYLNGMKYSGKGKVEFRASSMQAVYYPDF